VTTLQEIEWLDPLVEGQRNRDLERYVKQEAGVVPPHTRFFGACPWIMRADIDLDVSCANVNDLAQLIYLTVSRDNSCRFCYGATRMFMRMGGMHDPQIEKLEQDVETARLEPRVNLALDFARRVSRSNPPPGVTEKKALIGAGYSEAAIRELALYAGVVVFHNRCATLLALPPRLAERVSRTPLPRLLRFRFRKILERLTSQAPQEAPSGSHHTGPYGHLTETTLDGLPHARVLRKMLDEAWASPHLPSRTKAMVFAVIARGLGAAAAEREAWRLLAAQGLVEDQIEEILSNLASPALDCGEARILPYVRETIWYQPAPVQRRGRAMREALSDAQLLETVGTAALANMVCRVSLTLDEP